MRIYVARNTTLQKWQKDSSDKKPFLHMFDHRPIKTKEGDFIGKMVKNDDETISFGDHQTTIPARWFPEVNPGEVISYTT